MGNFGGHALPGSFFVIFSLWHFVQLSSNYFRSKRRLGPHFETRSYFDCPCFPNFPLEPVIKISLVTTALVLEIITGYEDGHGHGHFVNLGNGQHVCMYSFFVFAFVLEALCYYKFNVPNSMIYISYILAFSIEALLFYWHLHVQEPLEVQVHTLLLYIILITILALAIEIVYPRKVLPGLCRAYLIFLQGIWFWQLAFILYVPSIWQNGNWEHHEQMMLVTMIFCANILITLIFVTIIWLVIAYHYGLLRRSITEYKNGYTLADGSSNAFTNRLKIDSHDDFEAQIDDDMFISE